MLRLCRHYLLPIPAAFPFYLLLQDLLFQSLCSGQRINVRPKLDNLAQEIRGFLLPVVHRFRGIGVARGELRDPC